jgi:glycosyltransferase involved in cell wall biosynthesis
VINGIGAKLRRALFVSYYDYPDGDAGAHRVHALATLASQCGLEHHILGMGRPGGSEGPESRRVTTLRIGTGRMARAVDHLLFGYRLRRFLKEHSGEYTHIVLSYVPLGAMLSVRNYAKRHGAILIHDSVEWYSRQEFKLGLLDYQFIQNELLNRFLVRPPIKVIAISSFLQAHFTDRGCDVVRIPVILDMSGFSPEKHVVSGRTTIVYAGSPGRKDSLERIVRGYLLLTELERQRIALRIVGIDLEKLLLLCRHTDPESIRTSGITAGGRVGHSEVLDELRRADFTILIREDELRYSKAGFPTKVVESLACATPVICNDTSDIFEYLQDGRSAVRVEGKSPDAIARAIRIAAGIGEAQKRAMFADARECAERCFSPERYRRTLSTLLAED